MENEAGERTAQIVKTEAGELGTMGCDSAAAECQKNGEGEGAQVRVT